MNYKPYPRCPESVGCPEFATQDSDTEVRGVSWQGEKEESKGLSQKSYSMSFFTAPILLGEAVLQACVDGNLAPTVLSVKTAVSCKGPRRPLPPDHCSGVQQLHPSSFSPSKPRMLIAVAHVRLCSNKETVRLLHFQD